MKTFKEVISFAIERENEAAAFYRDMQQVVKFESSKLFLKELEEMEIEHAKILASINELSNVDIGNVNVEDLQIGQNMDEVQTGPEMSFQEVLILAIKLEEIAMNMYAGLANIAKDSNVKSLLLKLSSEESKHKNQLEKIYDEEIFKEN